MDIFANLFAQAIVECTLDKPYMITFSCGADVPCPHDPEVDRVFHLHEEVTSKKLPQGWKLWTQIDKRNDCVAYRVHLERVRHVSDKFDAACARTQPWCERYLAVACNASVAPHSETNQ